jgi:hypothetical protein
MRFGNIVDRFASALLALSLGIIVSGTKACQDDYELGVQSQVPSATVTGTVTPGDENGTATPSPTVTVSVTPEVDETTTPELTPAQLPDDGNEDDLFAQLSKLEEGGQLPDAKSASVAAPVSGKSENWLGGTFHKRSEEDEVGAWADSDSDGFSDELEESLGGDSQDAEVAPKGVLVTRLGERLSTKQISAQGREDKLDSDSDGLIDVLEAVVGSNPRAIDSDGDGVSDGREFELGADPVLADRNKGSFGGD